MTVKHHCIRNGYELNSLIRVEKEFCPKSKGGCGIAFKINDIVTTVRTGNKRLRTNTFHKKCYETRGY